MDLWPLSKCPINNRSGPNGRHEKNRAYHFDLPNSIRTPPSTAPPPGCIPRMSLTYTPGGETAPWRWSLPPLPSSRLRTQESPSTPQNHCPASLSGDLKKRRTLFPKRPPFLGPHFQKSVTHFFMFHFLPRIRNSPLISLPSYPPNKPLPALYRPMNDPSTIPPPFSPLRPL